MQHGHKSPPPYAGEADCLSTSENRTGGGDDKCKLSELRQRARKLRNEATEAEQVLWSWLRRRQVLGYKFRRQQIIGRYIVDFVCLEKRLVVEVDGSQHIERRSYDEKRSRWLQSQEYRVIRFFNNEVMDDCDAVIRAIAEQLRR